MTQRLKYFNFPRLEKYISVSFSSRKRCDRTDNFLLIMNLKQNSVWFIIKMNLFVDHITFDLIKIVSCIKIIFIQFSKCKILHAEKSTSGSC